jgi:succinate dehydrogenase / fumarate reductase cytochrome b subunit
MAETELRSSSVVSTHFISSNFISSNIGKKYLVGMSGLGLSLFVLIHMSGNLLLFVGPEAYNRYSYALVENPFLIVAELGLLAFFAGHLILGLYLALRNFSARKTRYAVASSGEKRTTLVQKTLWIQGVIILVFVVLHLITFKWGPHYDVTYNGVVMRDLYKLVVEVFQSPLYVAWYVLAVAILLFHLSHGLSSSLQSLGLNHPHYNSTIKKIGWVYAVVVGVGFMLQPLYVFFFQ